MQRFILLILILLCGCASNDEAMFRSNVMNPIPHSIKMIHMSNDRRAMHGALFFDFEGNEEDIGIIIQKNKLTQEKEIPAAIQSILSGAPWANEINSDNTKIFGRIEQGKYEWHTLYVFINKGRTYCIKM